MPHKSSKNRRLQAAGTPRHAVTAALDNTPTASFRQFSKFADREAKFGSSLLSDDDHSRYVPYSALKEYWTPQRIADVLRERELYFIIDTIQSRYLRTFSLLVYTNQVANLSEFTKYNLNDDKFPLKHLPWQWPKNFGGLFDSIKNDQWMFFPLLLNPQDLDDVDVDNSQLLPVEQYHAICQGAAANVYSISIDQSCNLVAAPKATSTSTPGKTFVLKSYHDPDAESTYENEINALRMLSNFPMPNIIKYYGSFRQHDRYNIVLEHANGGDLAQFFRETPPPRNKADIKMFWKSIFQVLLGLERIHHLVDGNKTVFGIHEDIKPDNILISRDDPTQPYDFTAKIVDFGLFSRVTRSVSDSSTAMGRDTQGNATYSSPETSYRRLHRQKGPSMVTTKADIFSMGAVFSAASAWMVGGFQMKQSYENDRATYHDRNLPKFHGSGYRGCFHNGHECIPLVYKTHKIFRSQCRKGEDNITPGVLDILERYMLKREANDRRPAREILALFNDLLEKDDTDSARRDESLKVPDGAAIRRSGSAAEFGKGITIAYLAAARQSKAQSPISMVPRWRSSDPKVTMLINKLKTDIANRDHFFYIDDSTSMRQHKPQVRIALEELSAITVDLDPNKVELAFASKPREIIQTGWRVEKFLSKLDENPFLREPDRMPGCFSQFLDDVIIKRLPRLKWEFNINFKAIIPSRKLVSIYIFTDGNWGEDVSAGGGLEKPLEKLMEERKNRGLTKEYVTFHFVRFGNSERGKRYLMHLDHLGQRDDCDIVDHKDSSSNVYEIIIGPLSPSNDMMGEDNNDNGYHLG